jgi:tetraacyldisaccharide 4'-kinase
MAFAGLARPEVFTETLQDLGVDLQGFSPFPDHYVYTSEEVHNLAAAARARGAEALITTEKDWARLGERWDEEIPLWVLDVEAHLSAPERVLAFLEE